MRLILGLVSLVMVAACAKKSADDPVGPVEKPVAKVAMGGGNISFGESQKVRCHSALKQETINGWGELNYFELRFEDARGNSFFITLAHKGFQQDEIVIRDQIFQGTNSNIVSLQTSTRTFSTAYAEKDKPAGSCKIHLTGDWPFKFSTISLEATCTAIADQNNQKETFTISYTGSCN